jgi:hypothetical protein
MQGSRRLFAVQALAAAAFIAAGVPAHAQETIKVGVLHSLSGTMAISETVLKDTVLMAIEEINAKGGVLGKKLEPVVVDPASNWPLFAEKARQLISKDKVVVTFGCWTSVSRKSVLPVYEECRQQRRLPRPVDVIVGVTVLVRVGVTAVLGHGVRHPTSVPAMARADRWVFRHPRDRTAPTGARFRRRDRARRAHRRAPRSSPW